MEQAGGGAGGWRGHNRKWCERCYAGGKELCSSRMRKENESLYFLRIVCVVWSPDRSRCSVWTQKARSGRDNPSLPLHALTVSESRLVNGRTRELRCLFVFSIEGHIKVTSAQQNELNPLTSRSSLMQLQYFDGSPPKQPPKMECCLFLSSQICFMTIFKTAQEQKEQNNKQQGELVGSGSR